MIHFFILLIVVNETLNFTLYLVVVLLSSRAKNGHFQLLFRVRSIITLYVQSIVRVWGLRRKIFSFSVHVLVIWLLSLRILLYIVSIIFWDLRWSLRMQILLLPLQLLSLNSLIYYILSHMLFLLSNFFHVLLMYLLFTCDLSITVHGLLDRLSILRPGLREYFIIFIRDRNNLCNFLRNFSLLRRTQKPIMLNIGNMIMLLLRLIPFHPQTNPISNQLQCKNPIISPLAILLEIHLHLITTPYQFLDGLYGYFIAQSFLKWHD